jgi:sec-independent protein translocase protein TatC
MTQNPETGNTSETFFSHLGELRTRLLYSLAFIGIAFSVCWCYSAELFNIIRKPIAPYLGASGGGLIYTGVMDKFMAHVKVSFFAAIVFSCPFWIYQAWKFIAPGLLPHERKYSLAFILSATLLFTSGICFVYFLAYPATFQFLMGFGGDIDKPMITIDDYVSFFITTTLVFGLVFELPLVIILLGAFGVVTANFLRVKRKYAVVILALVAAVITPTPDAITMLVMMIPLVLLYEVSIIFVGYFERKRAAAVAATENSVN